MAISSFGFGCRPHFLYRPSLFCCICKVRLSYVAAVEIVDQLDGDVKDTGHDSLTSHGRVIDGVRKAPEWKRWSSKDLGISNFMIAKPSRVVLNGLKKRGYDVYLVGGCVRDLILKRTPKDFDILTSAELKEVKKTFSRCEIVGKRFPICHVHIDDTIVEVSSFSTCERNSNENLSNAFGSPIDCTENDRFRWRNCLQRDFTMNGLMFDPYAKLVYDYLGGMSDIEKARVRTVIPASTSFQEDCARILRAIRIAARLGFHFTRETAHSVKNLRGSVLKLNKGRLLMEMNYMLAFGSAEASLRLLWKFGLLEILLPIQAAYFVHQGFRRRDTSFNMLLSLFSNLDKLLAPDRPCHASLWVGMLVFHKALFDRPRDPLVVATFCLAVCSGGNMAEALDIARRINRPHDLTFGELLPPQNLDSDALTNEVMNLARSVRTTLSKMTDESFIAQAMAGYPEAPYSDLVFIPLGLYLGVCKVFECVKEGKESGFVSKQGSRID